jgi:hypothetical protein
VEFSLLDGDAAGEERRTSRSTVLALVAFLGTWSVGREKSVEIRRGVYAPEPAKETERSVGRSAEHIKP